MAHTPGPWVIREPEDGELHEIYAENGGDLICYPVYTANQKANLPLIASAPELLVALKQAVSLLSYASQDGGIYGCNADEWFGMEKSCRAAIAKAEGRTDDQG